MPNDRPANRDRYGRLLPGTATPNPGGRPRVPDELRAIFEAASPEAARKLAELVHDDDAPDPLFDHAPKRLKLSDDGHHKKIKMLEVTEDMLHK